MQTFVACVRSALFVVWLVATVIPWAVISLVGSIFMRGTPLYHLTVVWPRIAILGARAICGVRWQIHGAENLALADRSGPIIVLPKHQSTWETFAFPFLLPHPLCFVFKRELLMVPFFGWALGRLDMIHIDRSKRTEAWNRVAEQGRRFLAQGNWIIMFPEGTRTPRGRQGTYKTGGTRLAVATGASILPIAVTSARCWPRRSYLLRPGLVDISIGRPVASAGRDPDELMREAEAWIEGEMHRLDPDAYKAAP